MDEQAKQLPEHFQSKSGFLTAAATVVFITVFISVISVVAFQAFNTTKQQEQTVEETTPEVTKTVQVPFDYEIVKMEENTITLYGKHGDMLIPFDPAIVTAYMGAPPSQKVIGLDELYVGQKIMLKMIPGQYAWLYVVD